MSREPASIAVNIRGLHGKKVSDSSHDLEPGVTTITVNSSQLAPGFYIVEAVNVVTGKVLSQQKLLISK
ncbi:MAG: hypothetical protein K0S12_1410 [Bacteroidetes bacterium]|nr:hypothetical protein [Bacteroidota bacterium]